MRLPFNNGKKPMHGDAAAQRQSTTSHSHRRGVNALEEITDPPEQGSESDLELVDGDAAFDAYPVEETTERLVPPPSYAKDWAPVQPPLDYEEHQPAVDKLGDGEEGVGKEQDTPQEVDDTIGQENAPDLGVILDRFAAIDNRLNTMNTVLREQEQSLMRLSEQRWQAHLKKPVQKLADIHNDLLADLADAEKTRDMAEVNNLNYLIDGVVDVLDSLGVDVVEVHTGDPFDSTKHRHTKTETVGDSQQHRTVGLLARPVHYYCFSNADQTVVVSQAKVPVRKLANAAQGN